MHVKVIDNFLKYNEFLEIKNTLCSNYFPWFWCQNVVNDLGLTKKNPNENLNAFFMHVFYENGNAISPQIACLQPIFNKLDFLSLILARANLYTPSENLIVHGFHVDFPLFSKETVSKIVTCVYYLENSDGKTVFEDGTEVQSTENRIALFPAEMRHSSTNCTNSKTRMVINLSYIPK
jgi:hypothetical protein